MKRLSAAKAFEETNDLEKAREKLYSINEKIQSVYSQTNRHLLMHFEKRNKIISKKNGALQELKNRDYAKAKELFEYIITHAEIEPLELEYSDDASLIIQSGTVKEKASHCAGKMPFITHYNDFFGFSDIH